LNRIFAATPALRHFDEPQQRLASIAGLAQLKSAAPATACEKIAASEQNRENYAQDRENRPRCLKKIVQADYRSIRAVNLFRRAA
jgi:hypothetical protein